MAFNAIINYNDPYVDPLIKSALQSRLPPHSYTLHETLPSDSANTPTLQFSDYELIDFPHTLTHPHSLANAYVIRKALIRKHYLSHTVSAWVVKHPQSPLKDAVKPAVDFELDYAEFLDDALVEAWELKESFERNEGRVKEEREWWILKPGMSERGQGIRLFSSEEELVWIFEEWDPEDDDDDEDDENEDDDARSDTDAQMEPAGNGQTTSNGIMTSQLRHFIAQPYIHPPLLLMPSPSPARPRKFHIRTYVLAVGALKVYVYKPMLALFAAEAYAPPWETDDLRAHLTNTCLQGSEIREGSVGAFWDLVDDVPGLQQSAAGTAGPSQSPSEDEISKGSEMDWKQATWNQICVVTGELFEAAARGQMIHFQPLPNAFEMFGLDFMVDAEGKVWLLEVNAFPDFGQTGEELKGLVEGFFEDVVDVAIKPHFGLGDEGVEGKKRLRRVLDVDLGRR